jgi:hypothetical protein
MPKIRQSQPFSHCTEVYAENCTLIPVLTVSARVKINPIAITGSADSNMVLIFTPLFIFVRESISLIFQAGDPIIREISSN